MCELRMKYEGTTGDPPDPAACKTRGGDHLVANGQPRSLLVETLLLFSLGFAEVWGGQDRSAALWFTIVTLHRKGK